MTERKSFFLPVIIIICGVMAQLCALGMIGSPDSAFITKGWPLIFIAFGLEMFFCQRRTLGAILMLFVGVAMFCLTPLDTSSLGSIWKLFISFWPVVLILFGVDSLLTGKSLISSIVAVIAIILIVYAFLGTLGIPIFKDLGSISLPDIPAMEQPSAPHVVEPGPQYDQPDIYQPQTQSQPVAQPNEPGGSVNSINYGMPTQSTAAFVISSHSGDFQLGSADISDRIMSGSIILNSGESLSERAEQQNGIMVYYLTSEATGAASGKSNWDLEVSRQKTLRYKIRLEEGYAVIDFRGMDIYTAEVTNQSGKVDIMLSEQPIGQYRIGAKNGDIRVYIPAGVSAKFLISGTENITMPDGYELSDGVYIPVGSSDSADLLSVEIQSEQQRVQVISSPN